MKVLTEKSNYSKGIFLIGLALLLFAGCKKDNNDDGNLETESEPLYDELSVCLTESFTFAIKEDGSLWARGGFFSHSLDADPSGYYFLTDDAARVSMEERATPARKIYVLKKSGTVWLHEIQLSDDRESIIESKPLVRITEDAQSVVSGNDFTAILKKDGTVWAIGRNTRGQFGMGSRSEDTEYPLTRIAEDVEQIAAGNYNIYLLKKDRTLWSAGSNTYGKLGYETSGTYQATFTKIPGMEDVAIIRAEGNNVMCVKNDGSAWSFGGNVNGTQGLGEQSQEPNYPHKIADSVKEVYPHGITCYFLKNDGTLWASGSNSLGQMARETPTKIFTFTEIAQQVEEISSAGRHIVVLQNRRLRAAGDNREMQLTPSEENDRYHTFIPFTMP